jgi:hypothetical protein
MKISQKELKQVAIYGLGGSFLASAFHLMNIYKSRRVPADVDVEVESLDTDPSLVQLIQLVQHQILTEAGQGTKMKSLYTKLVISVDRLLFLKDTLKQHPDDSGFENIEFGYVQLRRVQNISQKMLQLATKIMNPRQAAALAVSLKKISHKTEQHFLNVLFLLRKVPMHFES